MVPEADTSHSHHTRSPQCLLQGSRTAMVPPATDSQTCMHSSKHASVQTRPQYLNLDHRMSLHMTSSPLVRGVCACNVLAIQVCGESRVLAAQTLRACVNASFDCMICALARFDRCPNPGVHVQGQRGFRQASIRPDHLDSVMHSRAVNAEGVNAEVMYAYDYSVRKRGSDTVKEGTDWQTCETD